MALVDHIAANGRTHILFVAHDGADELTCLNRSLDFRKDGDVYRGSITTL
jgi:ABC-type molybdenum transport system ATPase subunit/photorepair protein PhrA